MIKIIQILSILILPVFILSVLLFAIHKKVPCYEVFIDGAKDGFGVAVKIIPYIVAIMVAIGMLRASGFIDSLGVILSPLLIKFNIPIDVLPIMVTRSLSGGATIGLFSDVVSNNGVNSYATKLAAIMVGSSETTFYVLAVYFGSIGIKKFRHAIITGILADAMGIILALVVGSFMFLK